MGYLFLFISFLYSFLFYLFYVFSQNKDIYLNALNTPYKVVSLSLFDSIIFSNFQTIIIQSFTGNLLYETILFFLIGIILFFYFNPFSIKNENIIYDKHNDSENKHNDTEKKISFFTLFLRKFSYYIAFFLFYISMYFIVISFNVIDFSVFIFIVNIFIFLIFFLTKLSSISYDFLRINSLIFSIFYTVSYISIIITDINYFKIVDLLNSLLVLLTFPTLLYYNKKIQRKDNFDEVVLIHFSVYIFVVFLFYLYFYLFHQNLVFWISFIATFFGIIWFEVLPKIDFFKKEKIILRYIGIILSYIGIIFGLIYLTFNNNIIILFILLLQVFYNLYIHKKYSNYISFFLGILLFFYVFYYIILYYNFINYKTLGFLIIGIILSYGGIIITYLYKSKIMLDYYIIQFFCHIVNILSVVIFLIYNNFDILKVGILLLLESIYFFLSYYKLNNGLKNNSNIEHDSHNEHDNHNNNSSHH